MQLSAVAARKAAKAAAEASGTPSSKNTSPPPPSQSPSPPPKQITAGNNPTSKRKTFVSAHAGPSKSKKFKISYPNAKNVRYFDPGDTSNAQNATRKPEDPTSRIEVSLDSDSEESEEEMEIEINAPAPSGPSVISVTKSKRAWSPSRPIVDSSDDEEPDPSGSFDPVSYLAPEPSKPELLPLSTFRPVLNNNIYAVPQNKYMANGKAVILVLQPNETVALVGTYSLCVLQGSLSLLGVTLSPSDIKHLVFAPQSSPLPILSWAATDQQGSCTFPIPVVVREQENITAVLIEYTPTGVEGLGRVCRVFENAFKPPRDSCPLPGINPPKLHIVYTTTREIHPFILPSSWEAALSSVNEHPDAEISNALVCLVKGPKKRGKSTLARTLVNRLLCRYRRVAFLECDLGQSEFTPGGMVALNIVENFVFGPPFTHPSLPYRAHYIGSTSPRANPSHYLRSIHSLLELYKLDLQFPVSVDEPKSKDERIHDAIPLVVNTMGWTKGLGTDLNARIEELVEASRTFNIDDAQEYDWPAPPQSQHIPRFPTSLPLVYTDRTRPVKVEAIHRDVTNTYYTPTDHRHLNILSYFHAVFPEQPGSSLSGYALNQITPTSWDASLPMCARYPYDVRYTQAFDQVYLIGPGYEDVVPSELTRVLNGAIVGLVSSNTTNRDVQLASRESSSLSYTPGEPPPDPTLSTCHGLALIRGIPLSPNPSSPHMHILTPVPTGLLAQTRLLVKGEMELPIWGMLDFREDGVDRVVGVGKGQVPYLQWGKAEGIGSEKRRVRRNLMRRRQM